MIHNKKETQRGVSVISYLVGLMWGYASNIIFI